MKRPQTSENPVAGAADKTTDKISTVQRLNIESRRVLFSFSSLPPSMAAIGEHFHKICESKILMKCFHTALLSVYDKTGLVEFATGLHSAGVRLLGSGGTAKKIREAGIPIECVAYFT